jgi:hypothetical protein
MRIGFCNKSSDSSCPKPPTFGSIFKGWSVFTKSPSLASKDNPGGTSCDVVVPSVLRIWIDCSPFSELVILVI